MVEKKVTGKKDVITITHGDEDAPKKITSDQLKKRTETIEKAMEEVKMAGKILV